MIDANPRKLVLFVCDAYPNCTHNRLPQTLPMIIDNDPDVVYGIICFHSFPLSDKQMVEHNTFINSTLLCMDFVIEVGLNKNSNKLADRIASIATAIAIDGIRSDIANDNVKFVHCKQKRVKFGNVVVVQFGANYFNIVEIIDRRLPPRNVKTLLLNIGLSPREWSSYYFDLLGPNGNCGVGFTRHIDFCQMFIEKHLDKIRKCIKSLADDEFDLPKSTYTNNIESFIMYGGH